MKSLLILTAASICLISMVSSETKIWGNRVMTDKLLITKDIKKPAQPYTTVSGEVAYKSVHPVKVMITQVRATDHNPAEGQGGTARLTMGGPGKSEASVWLLSKYNGGLDYTVEIYGIQR